MDGGVGGRAAVVCVIYVYRTALFGGVQHDLVGRVRRALEDDKMELADRQSIRHLARSIMEEEASKKSGYSLT